MSTNGHCIIIIMSPTTDASSSAAETYNILALPRITSDGLIKIPRWPRPCYKMQIKSPLVIFYQWQKQLKWNGKLLRLYLDNLRDGKHCRLQVSFSVLIFFFHLPVIIITIEANIIIKQLKGIYLILDIIGSKTDISKPNEPAERVGVTYAERCLNAI